MLLTNLSSILLTNTPGILLNKLPSNLFTNLFKYTAHKPVYNATHRLPHMLPSKAPSEAFSIVWWPISRNGDIVFDSKGTTQPNLPTTALIYSWPDTKLPACLSGSSCQAFTPRCCCI